MFICQKCGFKSEEAGEHCGMPMVEEAAPAPETPAAPEAEEEPKQE